MVIIINVLNTFIKCIKNKCKHNVYFSSAKKNSQSLENTGNSNNTYYRTLEAYNYYLKNDFEYLARFYIRNLAEINSFGKQTHIDSVLRIFNIFT